MNVDIIYYTVFLPKCHIREKSDSWNVGQNAQGQ